MCIISTVFLIVQMCVFIVAINHFVLLKENARITQKADSPFYMRDPDNLVVFFEQIRYNDYVENSFLELLHQREQIVDHLLFSVDFSMDLVDQAVCVMEYYSMEKRMSYFKFTPDYIKRFELSHQIELTDKSLLGEPICTKFAKLSAGPCCYDHLESFHSDMLSSAKMEREEEINIGELGYATDIIRILVLEGLAYHPQSWKFHTLSSYYWRLRGQPQKALECARLGVMLAPRLHKDIPLLSLGTILFRIGRLADADVILTAAVEHASEISVNHFALASALAMKHDFNRSLYHFDVAERLDSSLISKTATVRNYISCLDNLTKNTAKMHSYFEYIRNEVKEFKELKQQISQKQEKLLQHQVPLGARYFDVKSNNEDLLKRGQYCSTRTLSATEEPVLFCDFYSDMQMRLDSEEVDIESLERHLKLTTEAVIRQVSTEFTKKLNIEQIQTVKPEAPPPFKSKGKLSQDEIVLKGKSKNVKHS